jgi:hypothetical protein
MQNQPAADELSADVISIQDKFQVPEKDRLLEQLQNGGFNVPGFIFIPAEKFKNNQFETLNEFLDSYIKSFKVIVRSAHPQEEFFKGGTFDSLETYADIEGVKYARNHIIHQAKTAKLLSIRRQQKFYHSPEIDFEAMGVIVMPYIEGISVMAKMVDDNWEFGYIGDRSQKFRCGPYITQTPHDRRLLQKSQDIQQYLGFKCEIEYIVSGDGEIFVVQAKDISSIEVLSSKKSERSIRLDGVHRMRKRHNYRERKVYVMDLKCFYIDVIGKCEDMVHGWADSSLGIEDVLGVITDFEKQMENFALKQECFAVLGMSLRIPEDLNQIANHYLDDTPDLQKQLSTALFKNQYQIDYFLSEADTIIAKDKVKIQLCTHDAYGIDTVRTPLWFVYWNFERHDYYLKELRRIGFVTGDTVGIETDVEERPTLYRL